MGYNHLYLVMAIINKENLVIFFGCCFSITFYSIYFPETTALTYYKRLNNIGVILTVLVRACHHSL